MISLKTTLAAIIAFALFSAPTTSCEITPYIGIDGQINRMHFKNGYGGNLFPKHYPQINLYGGLKYDNSFAIEAGYVSEAVRSKCKTLYSGDSIWSCAGSSLPSELSPALFKTYVKIRGCHLGFVNTWCEPQWDTFRVIWGAGFAFLRAEAERNTVAISYPPIKGRVRRFKKDKAVLRLMIGSEYQFKNNLGIRASLFFLQTSNMSIKAQPIAGSYTPIIKPKDSFVYSLGIFYEF